MTRNPSTEILNFWRDHGNPWQQSLAINHPLDAVSLIEETGLWVTPGGNRLQRAVKRFAAFMMGRLPVALTAVVTVGLLTAGVNLGHAWQYLRWWSILVLAFQLVFVITHPYQAVKGHWFLGNRFIQFVVRLFLTAAFNVAAVLPAGLGLALEAFPFLAGPGAMSGIWAALTVGISVMGFMVAAPGVVGGIALSVMAHTR